MIRPHKYSSAANNSRAISVYHYLNELNKNSMNKNVIELYEKVLNVVLDDYQLTAGELFHSNDAECVQARMVLVVSLNKKGLSDKEIAECTQKMRRCSVCKIRNHYDDARAPWTVRRCLEHIMSDKVVPRL